MLFIKTLLSAAVFWIFGDEKKNFLINYWNIPCVMMDIYAHIINIDTVIFIR